MQNAPDRMNKHNIERLYQYRNQFYTYLVYVPDGINSGVTRGGKGAHWGAEPLRAAPKIPNNAASTVFNTVHFATERPQSRIWGRQSNLVTPLGIHAIKTHLNYVL